MTRIVVVGASGRLGSLVVNEASARPNELLVVAALGRGDALDRALLSGADVVIDVTTAGSTPLHARACAARGVPLLVATTGLTAEDEAALAEASSSVPVLVAANLSLSAHAAARAVRELSSRLPAYDVEVVEVHHRLKKDAPSGTALMLANEARAGRGAGELKRGRDGHAPRAAGEIGIAAVRGGDVVGEHTVHFLGDGERIEIVHRVSDRAVFARGALEAARFLVGKTAGRYAMADVLG